MTLAEELIVDLAWAVQSGALGDADLDALEALILDGRRHNENERANAVSCIDRVGATRRNDGGSG